MTEDSETTEKSFKFFRRDLSKIPCFRTSLLSGIGSGIGVGLVYFMFTSKVRSSTNMGFFTYLGVTLGVWTYCRYKWSVNQFNEQQFKKAIQRKILTEGTDQDFERRLESQSKEV